MKLILFLLVVLQLTKIRGQTVSWFNWKILFETFIERFIEDEDDDYKAAYEEQNKQFKEQLEKVTDQN